jgi:hypothetical protein
VNEKQTELPLIVENDANEVEKFVRNLPLEKKEILLKKVLIERGFNPTIMMIKEGKKYKIDWEQLPKHLAISSVIFRPIPRLKDPSIIESLDWENFVESLVAWKSDEKDARMILVHKTRLLSSGEQSLNPHSLEFTSGGTGKSKFYKTIGICVDKATSRSFLGFAKSPEEIYPGVIDNIDIPIGIDQIESQGAYQILSYLFSAMVQGEGTVASGAVLFTVKTKAVFSILGNPIGIRTDPEKSFASLIEHMSFNPAMGSRFGIIVYGTDFPRITRTAIKDKEIPKWREAIQLFRAVEEYSKPKLNEIRDSPKVWEWLDREISGYTSTIAQIIVDVKNETVHTFLLEHATGAQRRIRNGALNIALAEHLNEIALDKYDLDKILDDADDYSSQLVDLNIKSISNIASAYGKEIEIYASTFFNNLPEYLKVIVSAVELYRRLQSNVATIQLKQIPYYPPKGYFSNVIQKLTKRKRLEDLSIKLQKYFGFKLNKINSVDIEVFYTTFQPCQYIEPVGHIESLTPLATESKPAESSEPTVLAKCEWCGKEKEVYRTTIQVGYFPKTTMICFECKEELKKASEERAEFE